MSGNPAYREAAERYLPSFARRIEERIDTATHDLGFLYTLSCVSAWRLTGNEAARQSALLAAETLMERYNPTARIIQAWGDLNDPEQQGRMIIDCNMNYRCSTGPASRPGTRAMRRRPRLMRNRRRAISCVKTPRLTTPTTLT